MPASRDLEAFVDESIHRSRERGYHPTIFVKMRHQHGTVDAIKRLVISGDIQLGFRQLHKRNMLEWTMEAAVVKFPDEFTREEIEAAQWRLEQARDDGSDKS